MYRYTQSFKKVLIHTSVKAQKMPLQAPNSKMLLGLRIITLHFCACKSYIHYKQLWVLTVACHAPVDLEEGFKQKKGGYHLKTTLGDGPQNPPLPPSWIWTDTFWMSLLHCIWPSWNRQSWFFLFSGMKIPFLCSKNQPLNLHLTPLQQQHHVFSSLTLLSQLSWQT